jgi:hypothetical protein
MLVLRVKPQEISAAPSLARTHSVFMLRYDRAGRTTCTRNDDGTDGSATQRGQGIRINTTVTHTDVIFSIILATTALWMEWNLGTHTHNAGHGDPTHASVMDYNIVPHVE